MLSSAATCAYVLHALLNRHSRQLPRLSATSCHGPLNCFIAAPTSGCGRASCTLTVPPFVSETTAALSATSYRSPNQRLRARILYVDPAAKRVGLTLQRHLLSFALPPNFPMLGQVGDALPEYCCIPSADQRTQMINAQLFEQPLCGMLTKASAYCAMSADVSHHPTTVGAGV